MSSSPLAFINFCVRSCCRFLTLLQRLSHLFFLYIFLRVSRVLRFSLIFTGNYSLRDTFLLFFVLSSYECHSLLSLLDDHILTSFIFAFRYLPRLPLTSCGIYSICLSVPPSIISSLLFFCFPLLIHSSDFCFSPLIAHCVFLFHNFHLALSLALTL